MLVLPDAHPIPTPGRTGPPGASWRLGGGCVSPSVIPGNSLSRLSLALSKSLPDRAMPLPHTPPSLPPSFLPSFWEGGGPPGSLEVPAESVPSQGLVVKLLPFFPRSRKDPIGLVLPSGLSALRICDQGNSEPLAGRPWQAAAPNSPTLHLLLPLPTWSSQSPLANSEQLLLERLGSRALLQLTPAYSLHPHRMDRLFHICPGMQRAPFAVLTHGNPAVTSRPGMGC